MAGPRRHTGSSVIEELTKQPEAFDFHQAVRLLEGASGQRLGTDTPPTAEPVQLVVPPGLNFPRAAVVSYDSASPGRHSKLGVTFEGLTGPNGILPPHYTALTMRRSRAKDTTLRDFFDLFHHRLLSLRMRAWEKETLPASHQANPEASPGTQIVRSVGGIGTAGLRNRTAFPDDVFQEFAAMFANRPPTASGLERILNAYFGWPVVIEEFVGQWLYLDSDNQTQLPSESNPSGRNTGLGHHAVLGRRVWDVRNKIRIRFGPLDFPAFQSLQPEGTARRAASELARAYVGVEFDLEINPVLKAEAIPALELDPDESSGPRLGRTAWISSHGLAAPAPDSRFEVTA